MSFSERARVQELRRIETLARGLGPWASDQTVPTGTTRREISIPANGPDERPMRAWVYRNDAPPQGSLLLVPGLHYLGPADPRLDRFCRVLAKARILVLCPFLPDFEQLLVGPQLGPDALRAFDALMHYPGRPPTTPGVFSISFGSRPALEVAARRPIGGLMLFGGFADWADTMRFSIQGAPGRPYDPLNRPVVFLNLLPFFGRDIDQTGVGNALFEQVRRTWGRPEMKEPGALEPSARAIAERLSAPNHQLFLQAVGLEPGGNARVDEALRHAGDAFSHLDPTPWAAQVAAPAYVAHGREDDVIPHEHAPRLAALIPGARTLVTGAYAHTGKARIRELIPRLRGEAEAMWGLLQAMARIGCGVTTSRSY